MKKNSRYHGHLLYEFYAVPLCKYWSKKGNSLNRILAVLHKDKTKTDKHIRDNLGNHSVPEDLFPGILFLLIETDLYQKFFDVGLTPRTDFFNSERRAMEQYQYLSLLTDKKDEIWGRWLKLFQLRYDFNKNMDKWGEHQQEDLFEKVEKDISDGTIEQEFEEYLKKIEDHKTELKQKKPKQDFNDLKENLCSDISSRFEIINLFFQLSFYEIYRNWLRNEYLYDKKDADDENRCKAEEEIGRAERRADDILKKMDDTDFKNNHSAFYEDYRMMRLYHIGTNLIGIKTVHFKEFNSDERNDYLEKGKKLLEKMKPDITDTLQYHIWFEYYHYLHLQREMEHCLAESKIREGLIKLETALEALKKLEAKTQGGFSKILLKVKYQKRGLEYIKSSFEAMLLEKELEQPFGSEYQINEEEHANKETSFEFIRAWVKEIRKSFFR